LRGKKIAALGLAYKPDVDDLRESPAVEIIHLLQAEGAAVKAFEPFKPAAGLAAIEAVPTLQAALAEADLLLLLVNHTQFRDLTPAALAALTSCRLLVDTVGGWSGPEWARAGFELRKLGVRK
jgi:UDP-N-acetyl-D-mannosaminuronic acid dehydrogenase